jgi:hypothetical protein
VFGGEGELGMKAGVGGGGGGVQKYTTVIQCFSIEIFLRAKNFFVDDDSGLSATGSIR